MYFYYTKTTFVRVEYPQNIQCGFKTRSLLAECGFSARLNARKKKFSSVTEAAFSKVALTAASITSRSPSFRSQLSKENSIISIPRDTEPEHKSPPKPSTRLRVQSARTQQHRQSALPLSVTSILEAARMDDDSYNPGRNSVLQSTTPPCWNTVDFNELSKARSLLSYHSTSPDIDVAGSEAVFRSDTIAWDPSQMSELIDAGSKDALMEGHLTKDKLDERARISRGPRLPTQTHKDSGPPLPPPKSTDRYRSFVVAETSVRSPRTLLFLISKIIISGSKYPKNKN